MGVYYAYDLNGQELSTGLGTSGMMLAGSKLGRSLLTANIGAEYNVNKNFSLLGGYEGQFTLDGDSKSAMNAGYAGVGWRW